ncbi:MAG: nodulation protein NodH [Cypionkella sp.]|uniref:nodulation protein NodH n=1 Tax=Cypionkella sp. TaxID=2811411 RepID=UPI00272F52D4|nr:nodulation protein NodH [Cypionkella sp.]MDP2050446.1 nodulation protein NodH [Cypionkella sp.]
MSDLITAFTSFVIFAEMRTGSNFLEANLNTIDGVSCHGEAFNPFFIGGEGKQEMFGIDIAGRSADPAGFLRAMRAQTKGLAGFRYFSDHDPRVFDLVIADRACAKIILTRNQLESFISWKIAKESDQWWMANTKHLKTVRPRFDLDEFTTRIGQLQQFQGKLVHALQTTGQTAYYIDYEDIRELDVLNGLASFLGIPARIAALDFRFKKQNPEAIAAKVSNPLEMQQGLATVDWFNQSHVPNFEPRRLAAVAQYIASEQADLLFMPIKCGPDAQLKKWLQSYGPLLPAFDRQSLRKWKATHPGQRSFTVLRHPLARAYTAWCDFTAKEWMPELRPYLKRVHKFQLPPKGKPFETPEDFRAGFLVFLELIKHVLAGRTELWVMPQIASQGALIQGFAQVQSPDLLIREDKLNEGLAHLCADLGLDAKPLPAAADKHPYPLAELYGPDLEAAAREAYWRDYEGFGFRNWA